MAVDRFVIASSTGRGRFLVAFSLQAVDAVAVFHIERWSF